MLGIAGGDADGAVLDVGVPAFVAFDLDPEGVVLILLGQCHDAARKGRREQQGPARLRRGLEDEFHVLAKAEIEHLIGLVEHHRPQVRNVEAPAAQMIAQPPGRADDDVRPRLQFALLAARIHAADAGDDPRAGMLIQPGQLALDLQRQLARRRNDQRQRRRGPLEPLGVAQQVRRHREPIGHGLARAGLG